MRGFGYNFTNCTFRKALEVCPGGKIKGLFMKFKSLVEHVVGEMIAKSRYKWCYFTLRGSGNRCYLGEYKALLQSTRTSCNRIVHVGIWFSFHQLYFQKSPWSLPKGENQGSVYEIQGICWKYSWWKHSQIPICNVWYLTLRGWVADATWVGKGNIHLMYKSGNIRIYVCMYVCIYIYI